MSNETEKSLRDELSESLTSVQERLRDEQGRFAKIEGEITPIPAADTSTEATHEPMASSAPAVPAKGKSETGAATDPLAKPDEDPFPQSWKKDFQKHWGTIPPELKKYIREHEEQTRKAMVAQDEDRLTGKQLRELINPYLPAIQAQGMTIQQAFHGMLQQNYILRHGTPEEKKALLLNAAKTYGIDITEPVSTQGWVDPQVQALQQQLAEMRNWQQQQVLTAQQYEKASIDNQIAVFASSPGHEHFQQVSIRMGALLASNQAKDLEDAYQQAIWADPELRSTLLNQQQADAEAKRAAEAKAKAIAARNASGSVRGSSSGSGTIPAAPKGTLREELRAAFEASKDR